MPSVCVCAWFWRATRSNSVRPMCFVYLRSCWIFALNLPSHFISSFGVLALFAYCIHFTDIVTCIDTNRSVFVSMLQPWYDCALLLLWMKCNGWQKQYTKIKRAKKRTRKTFQTKMLSHSASHVSQLKVGNEKKMPNCEQYLEFNLSRNKWCKPVKWFWLGFASDKTNFVNIVEIQSWCFLPLPLPPMHDINQHVHKMVNFMLLESYRRYFISCIPFVHFTVSFFASFSLLFLHA